jgi:hypothetical protein
MATSVNIGPNSVRIDIASGDTLTDVTSLIDAAMLAHGWSEVETSWQGTTRLDKCFKAKNVDGVSEKFVRLGINLTYFCLEVYEKFDEPTHTGTNLAYHSDSTYSIFDIDVENSSVLFFFIHPRWLIVHSHNTHSGKYGTQSYGSFAGCVEHQIANPDDDPTQYPPHAWVNGYDIFYNGKMSPCRTYSGQIGVDAHTNSRVVTPMGHPSRIFMKPGTNIFNNKYRIFDLISAWDCLNDSHYVKGKIFGLKMMNQYSGSFGDVVRVKCDSNFFIDPNGNDTDHFFLETMYRHCSGNNVYDYLIACCVPL